MEITQGNMLSVRIHLKGPWGSGEGKAPTTCHARALLSSTKMNILVLRKSRQVHQGHMDGLNPGQLVSQAHPVPLRTRGSIHLGETRLL